MSAVEFYALWFTFWTILVLVSGCMFVVVFGPRTIDRLIAVDLGLILIAVDLCVFAVLEDAVIYMDTALIIAIISFLVTIVVARQLEAGEVFR